jgi:hypothetical protein
MRAASGYDPRIGDRLRAARCLPEEQDMTDLSDLSGFDKSIFWRVLPKDLDPTETKEWHEAFDAIVENVGAERATFILR